MKEKIYFDFDGTLYNSDKFYKEFLKLCKKYGITKTQEQEAEQELFNGKYLFDLNTITKYLYEKNNLPSEMLEEIDNLYSKPNLYDDVIESLEKIKAANKYEIIILTYGDISHQEKKIKSSNLSQYLKDIIITEEPKTALTKVDYMNGIFIDNHPYQIENLVKAHAKKVIRVRRREDKYSSIDTNIPVIEYDNLLTLVEKELL